MTRTVNTQIIVGNLGADPILRTLPSGDAVTTLSVGTSEEWVDKSSGELLFNTEWHSVSLYRRDAENAAAYLKKGSLVFIQGPSKTRKYHDKETGQDRFSRTIEAKIINYLGGARPNAEKALANQPAIYTSSFQGMHDESAAAAFNAADDASCRRRA